MNNLILQVFLIIFVSGGILITLYLIVSHILYPRKITTLKNYIKAGNYKSAINIAKEIINKDKENTEAHYYLGECYYTQGKYELALNEYKKAEKRGFYEKINEKDLREKLGELYLKSNNIEEALKEYILLTKKYTNESLYYFKAGELFEQKEMTQQAINYYTYSLKLNKEYAPALTNLGILLIKSKSFLDARKSLSLAVSKEPMNYKAIFHLGLLEKKSNNFREALKYFEKSERDKEFKVRSLMEKGIILMAQYKYEEAVVELDRALKNCDIENNIKMNVRYVLANCYEKKRNITEAIALWEEIYAINPNFKDVGQKLTDFQDLRMDDRMKDFLTATDIDFLDMCKGIITGMELNILEYEVLSRDSIEFLCLEPDTKWRNMKKKPKIIHISRNNNPLDEIVLRKLSDKMRSKNIIRAVIITSSGFSKSALAYAKERPIELIDKNNLQNLLKKVSI